MELSLFLDLITVFAVVLGILFGLLQLRHYHKSQERDAALDLLNSFQTVEFVKGILIILQELPAGLPKQEIEQRLGEDVALIFLVMSTWERIGLLVFNREVTLEMVNHAYSGQILISWQKLEQYVVDMRLDSDRQTAFEWFQWLAEQLKKFEKSRPSTPAYVAHRDWKQS